MARTRFAEWVFMLVSCSYQDSKIEVINKFEEGTSVSETHVAFLERCGCKNSKMKLPSQRVKGPEMTGSLKVPKLPAIIRSYLK